MNAVRLLAPTVALLTLSCGGLETPDLGHGAIAGRLQVSETATQPAYAYVLGRPDVHGFVARDGTFRLDGVPAGSARVVVFDGDVRAEAVDVVVGGASVTSLDLGRPPRLAAAVEVVANPLTTVGTRGLLFSVEGTPLRDVAGESGARLFPLPAGVFSVTATQPGFRPKQVDVTVVEGQSDPIDIDLDVELADLRHGCVSSGCKRGLACDTHDGQCYECVADGDCGPGGTCTQGHACTFAGGGRLCAACRSSADCGGGECVKGKRDVEGYCSAPCAGPDSCPSGYACLNGQCQVKMSCLARSATYGAICSGDLACSAALDGGKCHPPNRVRGQLGYCSAKVQGGCPGGFAPDPKTGFCARS